MISLTTLWGASSQEGPTDGVREAAAGAIRVLAETDPAVQAQAVDCGVIAPMVSCYLLPLLPCMPVDEYDSVPRGVRSVAQCSAW